MSTHSGGPGRPEGPSRARARIERRVQRFMDETGLWPEDGRLLVGVSGGPDSSALLLVLVSLVAKRSIELVAAYFDHRLRGPAAANREAATVGTLANAAGVRLVTGSEDVAAFAGSMRLSLEEAARRLRYDFLARTAEEHGMRTVAVGHTADDQAETVLMHILRGAGLTGLAGMAPRSRWPSAGHEKLSLVRPLLRLTRDETEAYCLAAAWTPIRDVSNRSRRFLRNRVRSELLPELQRYNPRIKEALVRLADAARDDLSALEELSGPARAAPAEGVVELDRTALREMPPSLRRHAIRRALLLLVGDLQGFGETHFRAVERAAVDEKSGARLDLPRGVSVYVERDRLALWTGRPGMGAPLPEEGVWLSVPGEAHLGPLLLAAGPVPLPGALASQEVDAAAIGRELCVRAWRRGDRMQPLGMKGTKKLQDLFVDAHLPREERSRVPVFEAARGIAWVGGLRLAEWARPREAQPTVVLSYRRD